ncbi:uncharacterized protein Z520_01048 [Fonsecaea multimorphosa CBS 102226]|uniref:Uncharacterized protein n=1 Tax=Fonsecaea multimorphosa CBS 102226 TaxID=1442371 RepID=A0A0D2K922_9EURO|nr:uncharacterized protein Z520_01048 [Fonsecaea multimorphosa CBS 102226]KIY02583.1 hypothetical protein Z520_01048 [Fonsecaea multimorphosa CBS 102226]OAL31449.1 hypothetical protein AYO22_01041 [Fonsecaea multimorphosa]
MDDAHAHPQSPAPTLHVRSRSIPPSVREFPTSQTTPKSLPHTRQQKLLQTRHAKFSGQRLSLSGISVPFPQVNRSAENDSPYFPSPRFKIREENGSDSNEFDKLSSASTESAILAEISNANTCRIRGLKKRAAIPVFQSSLEKPTVRNTGANTPSVYHDAYSDIHPPSIPSSLQESPTTMGLREVSVNLQRPSPRKDSPYYRPARPGSNRKVSQTKPRFNSEEYIDHIENELQMVKDAMYSPTTHMPWKEKLRKAKEENDRLKKEMEAIRASFEFELHETVERSAETELKLKRRIKDLEDEVELKKSMIHDLECDREEKRSDQNALDVLKARIEKLEEERFSLESTNRDMTKRNEVLTQLLALSPTKSHPNTGIPTPRRKSGRPMSLIIPRLPTSPVLGTSQSRPQSIVASPELATSDYFGVQLPSSPLASGPFDIAIHSSEAMDEKYSIDSVLGESELQGGDTTASRRPTLVSSSSNSPDMHVGGHVRAESQSQTVLRHPSRRRPRKFMPGSTQLKPLLLPTFTAESGHLPSTSPNTSPTRARPIHLSSETNRSEQVPITHVVIPDCLETPFPSPENVDGQPGPDYQSLDEVFASDEQSFQPEFLAESLHQLSSSSQMAQYQTPVPNGKIEPVMEPCSSPQISSWVSKTMSSLPEDVGHNSHHTAVAIAGVRGGKTPDTLGGGKNPKRQDAASDFETVNALNFRDIVEIPRPLFSRDRGRDGGYSSQCAEYPDSPLNPRKRRKTSSIYESHSSEVDALKHGSRSTQMCPPSCLEVVTPSSVIEHTSKSSINKCSSLPKKQATAPTRTPLEMLQHRNMGSRPLAALTIQTVYATLSRYTAYIQGFKQDPLSLARRVMANAWRSNWAMIGKLSWWVLGLFIGYRRPKADHQDWDWTKYDGESIANTCCLPDVDPPPIKPSTQPTREISPHHSSHKIEAPESQARTPVAPPSRPANEPKSGWGRSLYLWGKFSVAIMLAVGGAIVKGPAEMLRDADERRKSWSNSPAENATASYETRRAEFNEANRATEDLSNSGQGHRASLSRPSETADVARKARSFSSPAISPLMNGGPNEDVEHRGPLTEGSLHSFSEPTLGEDATCWSEDTLKPARSDRKGVAMVFHTPEHVKSAPDQTVATSVQPPGEAQMNGKQSTMNTLVQHLCCEGSER